LRRDLGRIEADIPLGPRTVDDHLALPADTSEQTKSRHDDGWATALSFQPGGNAKAAAKIFRGAEFDMSSRLLDIWLFLNWTAPVASNRLGCTQPSGLAAETFQLDFVRTGSGGLLAGYRFDRSAHDLHVLLPDPYTFPSDLLVEHLNTDLPGTTVMGGVVSGGLGPGDTRLFRDRDVLTSGVVGVRLPGMPGVPIVSQGCRPIGYPYIVTGADGALITELGGRPPLQRLRETVPTPGHDVSRTPSGPSGGCPRLRRPSPLGRAQP
jgi:hypothetical protein